MSPLRSLGALLFLAVATVPCSGQLLWPDPPASAALPDQWSPGLTLTLKTYETYPAGTVFRWYHDAKLLPGETAEALTLSSLRPTDAGNYWRQAVTGTSVRTSEIFALNVAAPPPAPVDTAFSAELPADDSIQTVIAGATDGSLIVGYSANGRRTWIKLSANGTRDRTFSLPDAAGDILARFPDGRIVTANPPYLFGADGTAVGLTPPDGFSGTFYLTAAAVQPDGRLLIAQGSALARLNPDGTLDNSFHYAVANPSGAYIYLDSLKLDGAGRIYAGGHSSLHPDLSDRVMIVFRLSASGAYDPTFATQRSTTGIVAVTPLADGRLVRVQPSNSWLNEWAILRDDGSVVADAKPLTTLLFYPVVVDPAHNRLFYRSDSHLMRWTIGDHGFDFDPAFYSGPGLLQSFFLADGELLVGGSFTQWDGHPTSGLARLHAGEKASSAPSAEIVASSELPERGRPFSLSARLTAGAGPFTFEWIAIDAQPLPADHSHATLEFPAFAKENLGRYQVRVTGSAGSSLSQVVSVSGGVLPSHLANLSARGMTGSGEDTLIAGMIAQSTGRILLRGAGPALGPLGVANFTPNPAIGLRGQDGRSLQDNDDWDTPAQGDTIRAMARRLGAFDFTDRSLDAALTSYIGPGNYTLLMDAQGAPGDRVGLLEVYADFTPTMNQLDPLRNLSMRAKTGPGDATAIAGFVITDPLGLDRPLRMLLRAVGPTLTNHGIVHPLGNPILTVYNSKGERIARNDDWSGNNTSADAATLSAAMKQVGAFDLPVDSHDAALLLDLPAGAYSMHATGGTGIVLLEIYLVR